MAASLRSEDDEIKSAVEMTPGGKRGKLKKRVPHSFHRAWNSGQKLRIPTFPPRRRIAAGMASERVAGIKSESVTAFVGISSCLSPLTPNGHAVLFSLGGSRPVINNGFPPLNPLLKLNSDRANFLPLQRFWLTIELAFENIVGKLAGCAC